jgi:hypothetical protein
MEDSKTPFCCLEFHWAGHAKEFLRKLSTIWARILKTFRQPCIRPLRYDGMITNSLKAGVQPTPEMSCTLYKRQTMEDVQHNCHCHKP